MLPTDRTGVGRRRNSGPRWLLLHGAPLPPKIWEGVATHLQGEVFAPEVTPRPTDGPFAQQVLARRVLRQLPPGSGGWRVVGHSFGGQVAVELALLAPDIVGGLTVLCSRDTPFPAFHGAADLLTSGGAVDVDATLRRWFRPEEIDADSPLIAQVSGYLRAADQAAWAAALRSIAAYDRSASTPHLTMPVTVIAAEHDSVSDPGTMAAMATRIPRSAFIMLAGAAHMSPFTAAADLAETLQQSAVASR